VNTITSWGSREYYKALIKRRKNLNEKINQRPKNLVQKLKDGAARFKRAT